MKSLYITALLLSGTALHTSDLLNATEMDLTIQVRDRQSNLLLNNHFFAQRTAIPLSYECDQFPLRLQAAEVGRAIQRNSCVLIADNIAVTMCMFYA